MTPHMHERRLQLAGLINSPARAASVQKQCSAQTATCRRITCAQVSPDEATRVHVTAAFLWLTGFRFSTVWLLPFTLL